MAGVISEERNSRLAKVPLVGGMSGRWREFFLWVIIAKVFGVLMMALVYSLTAWWGKGQTWLVFLVSGEICTLLRFLANDRYVFKHRRPTLGRCWRYHVANGASFIVYYTASVVLAFWGAPQLVSLVYNDLLPAFNYDLTLTESALSGIENMAAGALASAFSVLLSIYTNFFWIWKKEPIATDK